MRGKHRSFLSVLALSRITPADAGKTALLFAGGIINEDHPRGCGENPIAYHNGNPYEGSPPRMRGKQSYADARDISTRITPADAGKTKLLPAFPLCNWDHPRGCGENIHALLIVPKQYGSPPRMRGKPYAISLCPDSARITPADAGKTLAETQTFRTQKDHPRGCGENLSFRFAFIAI